MNIIFLVFGKELVYHLQTYFSILTVLKAKREIDQITIYTDNPQYYNRLKGYVHLSVLNEEILDDWINGTGYIFRAKIKAIEDSISKDASRHLLFLDGDTVFLDNKLDSLVQLLDSGKGIMYVDEGHPSRMKGASLRMWNAVKGKNIGGCTVSMKHNVWNSGVIGIPKGKLKTVVRLALELCDKILDAKVDCFTAEQYAFAVAMQEYCQVMPATGWIIHYWGNKDEWHKSINDFMIKSYLSDHTVQQDLDALTTFPFDNIKSFIKKSNTKRRLLFLLEKLFPEK